MVVVVRSKTPSLAAQAPQASRSGSRGRSVHGAWLPVAAALVFGIGAFAIVPLDTWLAQRLVDSAWPRGTSELRKLIQLAEVFASGTGVVALIVTAMFLDRRRWRVVPPLALLSLGSGLMANLAKLVIARARPRIYDLSASGWDSFGSWLPIAQLETPMTSDWQSMPSAHTATAVGLAIGLSRLYPQGRLWFAAVATMAGLQRILVAAHYPSDVLAGAALALAWVFVCDRLPLLNRAFDSEER